MTPAELIAAGLITAAAMVPIAHQLEQRPKPAHPPTAEQQKPLLAERYSYQQQCQGGPCVTDRRTGERLGF